MNEVNRTLFIPLYGKSRVSKQGIILNDPFAEQIWEKEGFPIQGRSASKWLAYNMAMRARVFDRWTERMLRKDPHALVLHIGCGLDSRCKRVRSPYGKWLDCDLPDVITVRRKYYSDTEKYHMLALDASDPVQIGLLPDAASVIVVLEGLSMYLTNDQLKQFLLTLQNKYEKIHIGVTVLYGVDDIDSLISGTRFRLAAEHTFTPKALVNKLRPAEKVFFKILFTGRVYRKIYRLYELAVEDQP